ncbi:ATP-binding protein [Oxalobacteraceae bacterium R-40]|uniref:histidine kinase n=1 Tax=Keguizhuia sedimenti TaxID=3064264 RepID=A0ABU1BKW8_9BURK|nr:ATP-binding protein [Oxalobacteraceae bacterium R-40]
MIRLTRSLQGRVIVFVLTVVLGVWLVTAIKIWTDVRHELDELLDGHLAQAAALLVVQQARDMPDDEHEFDTPTLHKYAPKVAFQVFHEDVLVSRSANAPSEPMIAQEKHFKSGFKTVSIDGQTWRVFAAYGAERDVQVYVGEQARSRTSILLAVLRGTLWPMAVALPLLALAVWWAVYRGVGPLRQLGSILAQREARTLEPLAMQATPAEITPIVDALNALFGRIGSLIESERRFTADAAHELRTPIAAIRAQAQVAMGETDDALRRHALQNTLDGCDRAVRLVEQLLTLSRMEADAEPAMEDVDLNSLVQRTVAELAPRALEKKQALEFSGSAHCIVRGNATLLTVLMRNLVDNAVRYSPPSAKVHVAVERHDRHFAVNVEDSGPGMSNENRRRLGERFFRVLGSGESGSGLGWSIVRRIASVHKMDLQVEKSEKLGGLNVRVSGQMAPDWNEEVR